MEARVCVTKIKLKVGADVDEHLKKNKKKQTYNIDRIILIIITTTTFKLHYFSSRRSMLQLP